MTKPPILVLENNIINSFENCSSISLEKIKLAKELNKESIGSETLIQCINSQMNRVAPRIIMLMSTWIDFVLLHSTLRAALHGLIAFHAIKSGSGSGMTFGSRPGPKRIHY